jgi:hypothetical protein
MIVYFAFFGKTRQETLFIRHAQMIMKRLTLALVVTSPLSSETKIILVIVVQTVYIVFKVFFRFTLNQFNLDPTLEQYCFVCDCLETAVTL